MAELVRGNNTFTKLFIQISNSYLQISDPDGCCEQGQVDNCPFDVCSSAGDFFSHELFYCRYYTFAGLFLLVTVYVQNCKISTECELDPPNAECQWGTYLNWQIYWSDKREQREFLEGCTIAGMSQPWCPTAVK